MTDNTAYRKKLGRVEERIRGVLADHHRYRFSPLMDSVAKAYLDLVLEYEDLEDLFRLAVLIPKTVLGWDAELYLSDDGNEAVMVSCTLLETLDRLEAGERVVAVTPCSELVRDGDDYLFPLPHPEMNSQNDGIEMKGTVLGVLAVKTGRALTETEEFFMGNYASLIAISITRRRLAQKNQQHLNFIKNLVADIGHNVIVPNIFFKVYLRRLSGKINRLAEIQDRMMDLDEALPQELPSAVRDLRAELANANEGILEEFDHIKKHYVSTSLFLETLLRQSHFEQGKYVLQKRICNFRRDIIRPQVERYEPRLRERGIDIDLSAGGVPDHYIEAVVDVGLISQVYANLISNAVKYTRQISRDGRECKFIAYGLELVANAFGTGYEGVKLNLFSTGPPLAEKDVDHIFEEGYRGSNVENERGTGHGLFFVREVVSLHGGKVGYEATDIGNNFYLMLPK